MIEGFKFAGGDAEGPWFIPDILVNVRRSGEEAIVGVIREVLSVRSKIHSYCTLRVYLFNFFGFYEIL